MSYNYPYIKNLLIYINPSGNFDRESEILIKVQIDNSLDLGWKKNDLVLVTNFDYKYKGIKSLVVDNENYCTVAPKSTKSKTITNLIKNGIIDNSIYWVHDIDAYQLHKITDSEAQTCLANVDMALTDYGRMPRWTLGSIFFRKSALDIFQHTVDIVHKYNIDEENALMALTTNNIRWVKVPGCMVNLSDPVPTGIKNVEKIKDRIRKINISYNFTYMNIRSCYKMAIKPIRVAHFHLVDEEINGKPNMLDFFIRGKNKISTQLLPDRIIKIFNKHGIH